MGTYFRVRFAGTGVEWYPPGFGVSGPSLVERFRLPSGKNLCVCVDVGERGPGTVGTPKRWPFVPSYTWWPYTQPEPPEDGAYTIVPGSVEDGLTGEVRLAVSRETPLTDETVWRYTARTREPEGFTVVGPSEDTPGGVARYLAIDPRNGTVWTATDGLQPPNVSRMVTPVLPPGAGSVLIQRFAGSGFARYSTTLRQPATINNAPLPSETFPARWKGEEDAGPIVLVSVRADIEFLTPGGWVTTPILTPSLTWDGTRETITGSDVRGDTLLMARLHVFARYAVGGALWDVESYSTPRYINPDNPEPQILPIRLHRYLPGIRVNIPLMRGVSIQGEVSNVGLILTGSVVLALNVQGVPVTLGAGWFAVSWSPLVTVNGFDVTNAISLAQNAANLVRLGLSFGATLQNYRRLQRAAGSVRDSNRINVKTHTAPDNLADIETRINAIDNNVRQNAQIKQNGSFNPANYNTGTQSEVQNNVLKRR